MDKQLFRAALTKFVAGVVVLGMLLFLPAGTLAWWRGWLLMGVLFVPMFAAGLVMMKKNPDLLRKRLNAKEEESEQKAVILVKPHMLKSTCFLTWLLPWAALGSQTWSSADTRFP
jgi:uncharacterized membrane protein